MTGHRPATATQTHFVSVEPRGIVIEVNEGETIMAAAERSGYHWPTLCHGDATCSICWAEVTEGSQNLSVIDEDERTTLGLLSPRLRATRNARLACRAKVTGDVTVRKPGVRPV